MQWYLFLIIAFVTLFFLWFGYYTNKKVYILYASVIGMILGVSVMASGISVPTGSTISALIGVMLL